jgi:hypothetical protein
LSSVYGFRRGLELDVLGDGGGGWLKSVSLAQKLIIIESACARLEVTIVEFFPRAIITNLQHEHLVSFTSETNVDG